MHPSRQKRTRKVPWGITGWCKPSVVQRAASSPDVQGLHYWGLVKARNNRDVWLSLANPSLPWESCERDPPLELSLFVRPCFFKLQDVAICHLLKSANADSNCFTLLAHETLVHPRTSKGYTNKGYFVHLERTWRALTKSPHPIRFI